MSNAIRDPNKPIVTYGLTLVNVLIFGIMVLRGIHTGDSDDLIRWGANYGPAIVANQWWRLLTCMFLHGGFLHILCNGYALYHLGSVVERMLGRPFYVVIYFVSGIMGSLASVWWNPMGMSVGASGAVFGIFGALLTFVFLYRHFIAPEAVAALRKNAIFVLALNFLLGFTVEAIDMAAHVGGFLGGVAATAVLCRLPRPVSRRTQRMRMAWVIGLGLAVTIGACATLPRSIVAWDRIVNEFIQTEIDVNASLDQMFAVTEPVKLSNQELAARFKVQVLQRWAQVRADLDNARRIAKLPSRVQRQFASLDQYVKTKEDVWEDFHDYLLNTEEQRLKAHKQKLEEIDTERFDRTF